MLMVSDSSKHLSVTVSIFKGPHAPEFEFFWPRVCIQTALMPLMSLCPQIYSEDFGAPKLTASFLGFRLLEVFGVDLL